MAINSSVRRRKKPQPTPLEGAQTDQTREEGPELRSDFDLGRDFDLDKYLDLGEDLNLDKDSGMDLGEEAGGAELTLEKACSLSRRSGSNGMPIC